MLIIITRCVHIGAGLILLSLFAFEMLIATPALRQADGSVVEHVEALRGQFRWLVVWSGLCFEDFCLPQRLSTAWQASFSGSGSPCKSRDWLIQNLQTRKSVCSRV